MMAVDGAAALAIADAAVISAAEMGATAGWSAAAGRSGAGGLAWESAGSGVIGLGSMRGLIWSLGLLTTGGWCAAESGLGLDGAAKLVRAWGTAGLVGAVFV